VFEGDKARGGEILHPDVQEALKKVHVKEILSTDEAFAAISQDGTVFAWGNPNSGGEIRDAKGGGYVKVEKISRVFSTSMAFATLDNDGYIDAWGNRLAAGFIPEKLKTQKVKMIYSNDDAFVAHLNDNTFVPWGCQFDNEQLKRINLSKGIFSSRYTFAALLNDGSVYTWGHPDGKIPQKFKDKLKENVIKILPNGKGFTALCKNGDSISWS
jgi:alpha-tubulin suppressor-like RCC1 family protein